MSTAAAYNIQEFNPAKAKPFATWLVIGPRGSGKSHLTENIMYHQRANVDLAFASSPTIESLKMFEKHIPTSLVSQDFEEDKLTAMISVATQNIEKGKTIRLLQICDDHGFDGKVFKTKPMTFIYMNGRHVKLTHISCLQYVMSLPAACRSNVDYIMALADNKPDSRKKLHQQFFGSFPNYQDFCRVFSSVTDNYGALVIDNRSHVTSVQGSIFWYRAPETTPPFRLGRKRYWYLDKRYREKLVRAKQGRGKIKAI
jgi:hypothetical protein